MSDNLALEATQAIASAIHQATYAHLARLVLTLRSTYRDLDESKVRKEIGWASQWCGSAMVDESLGLDVDLSEFGDTFAVGTPVTGTKLPEVP